MPKTDSTAKKGLGRGFDSLLPNDFDASILVDAHERIQKVKLSAIRPNADQPRRNFDQESINQLAMSIKQHGVLQPLILTPIGNGKYEIVAGERRWRASIKASIDSVPAIVRSTEELGKLEIALVENVQRVDLSPLEQAMSIERLHQQFNVSYKDISERLNKAETTIINIVRLLQLPDTAKEALDKGLISEGHARAILALRDMPDAQEKLLSNIKNLSWSVRQAEQFVRANKLNKDNEPQSVNKHMERETDETKNLGKLLSAPVTIKRTAHGGKLEIGFTSDKELNKLIERLIAELN